MDFRKREQCRKADPAAKFRAYGIEDGGRSTARGLAGGACGSEVSLASARAARLGRGIPTHFHCAALAIITWRGGRSLRAGNKARFPSADGKEREAGGRSVRGNGLAEPGKGDVLPEDPDRPEER